MSKGYDVLSLDTIPTNQVEIQSYYKVDIVQKYFDDFEKVVSINQTVEDLLQTVDLIALAYQMSYQNGLKCAPILGQIKSDYLDLVSQSSVTILRFKSKSENAVFSLHNTANIFTRLNQLVNEDEKKLIPTSFISDLTFLKETLDENETLNAAEMEEFFAEINQLNQKIGLDIVQNDHSFSKLKFKKLISRLETELSVMKNKNKEKEEKKILLFQQGLKNIALCSEFAHDMENETTTLITKVSALKTKADSALKSCIEQDVTEKEKQKALETSIQQAHVKRASLEAKQIQLDKDIEDVLQLEAKIEKKLELASSRAFWIAITGTVASMVASGLNAYVQTRTAGMSNINTKIQAADSEVEQLKEKKEQKEKELEKTKQNKEEADEKLKEISEKKDLLVQQTNEESSANEKLLQEIARLKKDEEKQKKVIANLEKIVQQDEAVLKGISDSFATLSQHIQEFKKDNQSELEKLQEKEDKIYEEKKELQKEKRTLVGDLAGVLEELKNANVQKNSLEMLINALKLTSETIQKIIVAFERIKRFWEAIKIKCEDISQKSLLLSNNVKLVESLNSDSFKENYHTLIHESFFNLVFSWIALERLNSVTLEKLDSVLTNLESTFNNPVEINAICEKIKNLLEEEKKKLTLDIPKS